MFKTTLRFLLLIRLLLLFTSEGFAQDVTFVQGKEFQNKNGVFKYVIGEDKAAFYVLRQGTKGAGVQNIVEKYNSKSFQLEWSKDVSFEKDLGDKIPSDSRFLESFVTLSEGKIYFIISLLETRKNSRSVYIKSIDTNMGDAKEAAQLLMKEDHYKGLEKFDILFSQNASLVLIKGKYSNVGSDVTIKHVRLIELKNYKEIYTKEMPSADANGELKVTGVTTDNEGNLICIYAHTGKPKDPDSELLPGLGKIPLKSIEMKSFDLNIGVNNHAYLITNNLQYDKNYKYAIVTGIFIDVPCKGKKNCERKEGEFFMKIDLDQSKVVAKEHYYFDDKFHTYYRDLFDKLNTYKRLSTEVTLIDPSNENVYSISLGDRETILVTYFSKDGKLLWRNALPRGLTTSPVNGYLYAIEKGIFYMVYTDHPKNAELDIHNFKVRQVEYLSAVSRADVIGVCIDKAGNAKQKVLSSNGIGAMNFNPETIDNLSERPPVYNMRSRGKEVFIRFNFSK
jgi:hypothetical protein